MKVPSLSSSDFSVITRSGFGHGGQTRSFDRQLFVSSLSSMILSLSAQTVTVIVLSQGQSKPVTVRVVLLPAANAGTESVALPPAEVVMEVVLGPASPPPLFVTLYVTLNVPSSAVSYLSEITRSGFSPLSAAEAFTIPHPYSSSHSVIPRSSAVASSLSLTCWLLSSGQFDQTSAATPATCGVAIDVPLMLR